MDNYNYPPGSDTPWAPWNQTEPKLEECPFCNGTGKDDEDYDCHKCGGDGVIEVIDDGPDEEPYID